MTPLRAPSWTYPLLSLALLSVASPRPAFAQQPSAPAPPRPLVPATKSTAPPPTPGLTPSQRADELYAQGVKAGEAGEWKQAFDLMNEAFRLKQDWQFAGNLGLIELKLGMPKQAAEHLDFYLNHAPADAPAEERQSVQDLFTEARGKIGMVTVTVNVAGAEVLVDGQSVGRAPLPSPVFVEPGRRIVEARMGGYETNRTTIDTAGGKSYPVTIKLTPLTEQPPPPTPGKTPVTSAPGTPGASTPGASKPVTSAPPSGTASQPGAPRPVGSGPGARPIQGSASLGGGTPIGAGSGRGDDGRGGPDGPGDEGGSSTLKIVAIIGGSALAVGGIATGVAFMLAANSASDEARAKLDTLQRQNPDKLTVCPSVTQGCGELGETLSRWDRNETIATAAFAAGGVFAVATAAFVLVPLIRPSERQAKVQLVPIATPSQRGLFVTGSF